MSRASLYIPLGVFVLILGLGYIGFDLGRATSCRPL